MDAIQVLQPGALRWVAVDCDVPGCTCNKQRAVLSGWGWAVLDGRQHDPAEYLVAALRHIAEHNGVTVDEPLPENFDAQWEALDTIAIARWRDDQP